MKSIIIIIDYFGAWPEWFPIFLESCRKNPTITWLFHTDCNFDDYKISNVVFKHISKDDYIKFVNERLGVQFKLEHNYKLCEIRPMYGVLYEDEIRGYDFFGYGDIDVLYGDIRKFYTDKVLKNNVISTHNWCVSGHLALIKNKPWLRNAFRLAKNWKTIVEDPLYCRFDEDVFTYVFRDPRMTPWRDFILNGVLKPFNIKYRRKLYLIEQFTTPLTPARWRDGNEEHPTVWFWKDGHVTNASEGDLEYIYLHFMNYKFPRFMSPRYGKEAFWQGKENIVHVTPEDFEKGIRIDRFGFYPIESIPAEALHTQAI